MRDGVDVKVLDVCGVCGGLLYFGAGRTMTIWLVASYFGLVARN